MQRQRGELIPVGKSSAACPVQAIRDRPRRCTTSRRTIRREARPHGTTYRFERGMGPMEFRYPMRKG